MFRKVETIFNNFVFWRLGQHSFAKQLWVVVSDGLHNLLYFFFLSGSSRRWPTSSQHGCHLFIKPGSPITGSASRTFQSGRAFSSRKHLDRRNMIFLGGRRSAAAKAACRVL